MKSSKKRKVTSTDSDSDNPTIPEVNTEKKSESPVEEQATSSESERIMMDDYVVPPRFLMTTDKFIAHLEEILNQTTQNKEVVEPCIRSKLDAALENVLVKKLAVDHRYSVVDDHGWPVNRNYSMVPKPFMLYLFQLHTTILQDNRSLFILIDFGPLSYRLVECLKTLVPFVNDRMNVEKIRLIENDLFRYLSKIGYGRPLPSVATYEKNFLEVGIPTEVEGPKLEKVERCGIYRRVALVNKDINPLNVDMPPLYKLFRTIFPILQDHSCMIVGKENEKPMQLEETYSGDNITVVYECINFNINLVEGYQAYFLIIRDSKNKYLLGHRILPQYVPTFKEENKFINADNIRMVALNYFLKSIMDRAVKLVRPKSRSSSR